MITFFGTVHHSGGCGTECLGAIELLRSRNVPVRVILPNEENPADQYLKSLGVQMVKASDRAVFKHCPVLISFGEGKTLFPILRELGADERPGYVVYSDCMGFVTDLEVEAHQAGLIDEFFFQSRAMSDQLAPQLARRAKKGVTVRHGYKAFLNTRSPYLPLRFSESVEPGFRVLKVGRDHEEKWHPETWRMMCGISAPGTAENGNVHIEVAGWGPEAEKKVGDPSDPTNRWHKQLNITLHTQIHDAQAMADLYQRSDVLLHICDPVYEESAGRVILEAQASGVVVVADNRGGIRDLIVNGETGYLVDTPEEATFRCSELAFYPERRRQMAGNAYARLVNGGHGDSRACWPWWQGLVKKLGL